MYKPVYTGVKEVYKGANRAILCPGEEKNESFEENTKYKVGGRRVINHLHRRMAR